MTTLRGSLEHDLVIIDLGPSLGALNRSALIGSTHFITPVAADLFSLYALENIGHWIREWAFEYKESMDRLVAKNPNSKTVEKLKKKPDIEYGYIGYTVQQYIARSSGGQLRPTAAYDRYKKQIPNRSEELQKLSIGIGNFNLGTVPNMFSMVALAQNAHAPISDLSTRDDVRGAQVSQQKRYRGELSKIFSNIAKHLEGDING